MKNKSKQLPTVKASVGPELFSTIEALRYRLGMSRSSFIRILLGNKLEQLAKLLKQKEIDELLS